MSVRSLFQRSQPRRKVRRGNHGHAGRRPRFETFEDRRMLSFTTTMSYPVGTEPQAVVTADFNHDGTVNTQDVLAFLNAWNAGDGSADINGDGSVNTQDVLAYLNLWNVGC